MRNEYPFNISVSCFSSCVNSKNIRNMVNNSMKWLTNSHLAGHPAYIIHFYNDLRHENFIFPTLIVCACHAAVFIFIDSILSKKYHPPSVGFKEVLSWIFTRLLTPLVIESLRNSSRRSKVRRKGITLALLFLISSVLCAYHINRGRGQAKVC